MSNVIKFPPQVTPSAVMEAAAERAVEAFAKTPEGKAALEAELQRLLAVQFRGTPPQVAS